MPEIIHSGGGVGVEKAMQPIVTATFQWNYQANNGSPPAGAAYQTINDRTLTFNVLDNGGNDRTTALNQLVVGDTIACNGVTWNIISVGAISGGTLALGIAPAVAAPPFGVTGFSITTYVPGTGALFPLFNPIVPPPVFGLGGGPPPTFPPPTPPPIGAIPPGVLVGPAIKPAAVPPSVAGFPLIQFKTGSATSPTAASVFPEFTTTFPVPTIVVDAANFAVANAGHIPPWTQPPPAQTASTAPIVLDGWGPGVPPGAPTAPGGDGRFPRTVSVEGMMVQRTPEPEPEPEPTEPEPEPEPEHKRPSRRRR